MQTGSPRGRSIVNRLRFKLAIADVGAVAVAVAETSVYKNAGTLLAAL